MRSTPRRPAQTDPGPAQPAPGQALAQGSAPDAPIFAVEFRTGPGWDPSKPAAEQAHFRDHSANLARLRKEGRVVIGARYADKGFIVMTGSSADDVRVLLDADPAVQRRVFDVEVNEFFVFYAGCVAAASRRRQGVGSGRSHVHRSTDWMNRRRVPCRRRLL